MQEEVMDLLSAQHGHFLLESGHHGVLWLELESLCVHPQRVKPLATELAQRMEKLRVDAICGPLVEGAFVGLLVASELDVEFYYSERFVQSSNDGLFPAGYRVPKPLQERLRGKRIAIVNDVINAGSAVKGTFTNLEECGATVAGIGSLLSLGSEAAKFASSKGVVLETLASLGNDLWAPAECPQCASGIPLEDVGGFAESLRRLPPERRSI